MPTSEAPLSARAVTDQAAAWFAKRDAGRFSDADQHELDRWIAADPAHQAAWAKVQRLWSGLDGTPVSMRSAARDRVERWQVTRKRTRATVVGAAALSLVLLATTDLPLRLRADAVTATGERRDVTLEDGSRVRLNTASAIAVDYTADHRTVRLLAGEAEFEVAPNPARPFTVEAQGGSATALGTRYLVRLGDGGARVTVTQHSVRVRASGDGPATIVAEGQSVAYADGRLSPRKAVDTWAQTGWMRGKLVFRERPLGEVVAEIGRYHPGLIRVLDRKVAARPISGVFQIDDPVGAVDSLEKSFGLHSVRLTDRLIFITR